MVLQELILNSSTLGAYHSLEETDFQQFVLWGRVWQFLKELIFNSLYFGGGCGGVEKN